MAIVLIVPTVIRPDPDGMGADVQDMGPAS
jgi:hypothetical protein